MTFDSLSKALDDWFDKPLAELPDALRHRVETDFFPMPWDSLSPDQRRSGVAQWDYRHDPATEHDRKFWRGFFVRKDRIKKEIETWDAVPVPSASDVEKRDTRLSELRRELVVMDKKQRNGRGDYLDPRSKRLDTSHASGKADYIPYTPTSSTVMPLTETSVKKMQKATRNVAPSPVIWGWPSWSWLATTWSLSRFSPGISCCFAVTASTPHWRETKFAHSLTAKPSKWQKALSP